MADIEISPLIETWRIANLTNTNFGLVDVPGLTFVTSLPKMVGGVPQWFDALDHTTSDLLSASDTFRNAFVGNLVGSEGYKHTHEGLYDTVAAEVSMPDATNWHSHYGLGILTAGGTSNADALHTHDNFISDAEVDALIAEAINSIDLSDYVRMDGSITQLSDITSDGETIEAAVALAHPQGHTLLEHLDDDPVTMVNLLKLFDGSNADCCHVHSGGGGTFDGEHNDLDGLNDGDYWHLTESQYDTLTDGSNADALHIHAGGDTGSITTHSDVDTLTSPPVLNQVLRWDGTNFVPVTDGETLLFSITSFSDGISANQLIGIGDWKTIGALSFTATYANEPVGMTAEVAMSGSNTNWASNLSMTPTTGPEINTEAVEYPAAAGTSIIFTLSQDEDGTTDTETVAFPNYIYWGITTKTSSYTEADIEGLGNSGVSDSKGRTITLTAGVNDYMLYALPQRLGTVTFAVDGFTGGFQAPEENISVTNSAGYTENYRVYRSTNKNLGTVTIVVT